MARLRFVLVVAPVRLVSRFPFVPVLSIVVYVSFVENERSRQIGVTDEGKRVWSFKDTDPLGSVLDPLSKGVHRALVVSDSRFVCIRAWVWS